MLAPSKVPNMKTDEKSNDQIVSLLQNMVLYREVVFPESMSREATLATQKSKKLMTASMKQSTRNLRVKNTNVPFRCKLSTKNVRVGRTSPDHFSSQNAYSNLPGRNSKPQVRSTSSLKPERPMTMESALSSRLHSKQLQLSFRVRRSSARDPPSCRTIESTARFQNYEPGHGFQPVYTYKVPVLAPRISVSRGHL